MSDHSEYTLSPEPCDHHPGRLDPIAEISQVEGLPLIKVELGQEMEVSAMKQVPSYLGLGGIVKLYLKMEYIILLVSRAKIARLVSRRNRKEKYRVEDRMDIKNDKLAPPYCGLGTSDGLIRLDKAVSPDGFIGILSSGRTVKKVSSGYEVSVEMTLEDLRDFGGLDLLEMY
ncbi:conserved hypothetical protein [Coccidioides posadasii str. Silveira]|uniref:Uncharacterized protein n=1 Tax=Coccidioides posadasii (strain RMSCC 757 / Silveira) TaxID=443226 RepID=E9D1Y1_COCPS|nr:conserved hypothetical protein [Coccidioides posadasii str. Silveira]